MMFSTWDVRLLEVRYPSSVQMVESVTQLGIWDGMSMDMLVMFSAWNMMFLEAWFRCPLAENGNPSAREERSLMAMGVWGPGMGQNLVGLGHRNPREVPGSSFEKEEGTTKE